ncbi:MAG: hypothetical protein NVSMB33_04070 [Ktedonobacteraceae bacterium]
MLPALAKVTEILIYYLLSTRYDYVNLTVRSLRALTEMIFVVKKVLWVFGGGDIYDSAARNRYRSARKHHPARST